MILAAAFGFGSAGGEADVRSLVNSAFAAWESPVLGFAIAFDAATNPSVRTSGYEIELHAIAADDPLFVPGALFGAARWSSMQRADPMLTNGALSPGAAVRGGDMMLAPERIALAANPLDPYAGLRVSPNVDLDAVMSDAPATLEAGFFTSLRPDDFAGRDVLDPAPSPATALLFAAGLAGLVLAGIPRHR